MTRSSIDAHYWSTALLLTACCLYLLLLPSAPFSRPTYLSENALLTDYAGSKYEEGVIGEIRRFSNINSDADLMSALGDLCDRVVNADGIIECIQRHKGSDGTEAMVLVAPQHDNHCGMAMLLSLMSSFGRAKHWARDIVYLFPETREALEGWLQAYHSVHSTRHCGVIQTALVLHIPGRLCLSYHQHEVFIEGVDGLLPNLDLVNTITKMGAFKKISLHVNGRPRMVNVPLAKPLVHQFEQLIKMVWRQATASQVELHAPFLKYRIDALTLKARSKQGIDSSMRSTFETVEGTVRSMNNLLEHMHQSFFFYLLPKRDRFVSIANYIAIPGMLACIFFSNAYWSGDGKPWCSVSGPVSMAAMTMAVAFLLPFGPRVAIAMDLANRLLNRGSGDARLGSLLYGTGLALLSLTNVSLAILMGLLPAVSMLSGHRKLALALINPLYLLVLNRHAWNFGIPYLLLYPANLLLSR